MVKYNLGMTLQMFLNQFDPDQYNAAQPDELRDMPYAEYLQTTYWSICRKRILRLDQYCCWWCDGTQYLQVHHLNYSRRGQERDTDLVTLCKGCHFKFHDRYDTKYQLNSGRTKIIAI